jgi:hypothetical protein
MHGAEIAELFLSSVIDTEKAATIVGDLVETSSLSISTVLRIAGADLLTQTLARPGEVVAMAAAAFIAQFAASGLTGLVLGPSLRMGWPWPSAVVVALFFSTQIAIGVCLARRANTRAMAVCIALTVFDIATGGTPGYAALWQIPMVIGIAYQRRQDLRHA